MSPLGAPGPNRDATTSFPAASRGGERRVRAAVSIARRLADAGLRYRTRELQLLAIPCAVALLTTLAPLVGLDGTRAAPWAPWALWVHPAVVSVALCVLFLAVNAGLSLAAPWADQHVFPIVALLVALAWALNASGLGSLDAAGFPGTAAVIALCAALAARALRLLSRPALRAGLHTPPARRSRPWVLPAGTALLAAAALLIAGAGLRALVS